MENQIITQERKEKFSIAIRNDAIQKLINNTLGDPKRASRFTASISSVVATNPGLQVCDVNTVITSALVGEALELPPSPQLGYFYMVPFEEKKWNPSTKQRELVRTVATFVLGYKGYIQLAIRSGLYSDIDSLELHEGEYLGKDPETGRPRFKFIEDDDAREKLPVIGYLAYLELKTGFKKVIYWPYSKMLGHADRYSAAFHADQFQLYKEGKTNKADEYKFSSFWYKDFDGMAKKTMLRQLISKWGIMSIELQQAFENDTAFTDENGNRIYPDNDKPTGEVVEEVKAEVKEKTATVQPPKQETTKADPKTGEVKDTATLKEPTQLTIDQEAAKFFDSGEGLPFPETPTK